MKTLLALALSALLIGCSQGSPEDVKSENTRRSQFYNSYIKDNTYDVCIRGTSYVYLSNGNASQAILLLDPQTSRVIPCKEVEQ